MDGQKTIKAEYVARKSSNSSMYYEGIYDGPVTKEDVVAKLGSGSWGHRFQSFGGGRFVYIKQTD